MGLFDFLKQIPTRNELKGSLGEWLAKTYAKTFPDALVLHDIVIDGTDQYKSQIDLLIVGTKGVYVVEIKCTLMLKYMEIPGMQSGITIAMASGMKSTALSSKIKSM